jgi:hypothetical protein
MRADLASLIFVAVLAIPVFTIAADHSPLSISEDKDRAAKSKEAEEALRGKDRAQMTGFGAFVLDQWRSFAGLYADGQKAGRDFSKLAPAADELREYQRARGLEATGVLNATTLVRLMDDLDLIQKLQLTNAINLGGNAEPIWSEGFVVVEGTWVVTDGEFVHPLQKSKITCNRAAGRCRDLVVEFLDTGFFIVWETEYTILSWEGARVRAISSDALCVDVVIEIHKGKDKKTEKTSGLVTKYRAKKTDDLAASEMCQGLAAHVSLRLDPGYKVKQRVREDLLKKLGIR